jgi:hypothetical protein
MRHRSLTAISASALLAASTLVIASSSNAQPQDAAAPSNATPSGSFALSGDEARAYQLPDDVREVWSTTLRIDPSNGKLFYQVESIRDDSRPVRWMATYTGTKRRGFDSPCITTSVGSVRLVSDPAVTGQGFVIDAVNPAPDDGLSPAHGSGGPGAHGGSGTVCRLLTGEARPGRPGFLDVGP